MDTQDWKDFPLILIDSEVVHGAAVLRGSRIPASTLVENVDAFMEFDGKTEEEAIVETLNCFPGTPGGVETIRALLAYRDVYEHQLQP